MLNHFCQDLSNFQAISYLCVPLISYTQGCFVQIQQNKQDLRPRSVPRTYTSKTQLVTDLASIYRDHLLKKEKLENILIWLWIICLILTQFFFCVICFTLMLNTGNIWENQRSGHMSVSSGFDTFKKREVVPERGRGKYTSEGDCAPDRPAPIDYLKRI